MAIVRRLLRINSLANMPDEKELHLTALSVGDVVFAGFPGEPFTEIGLGIKSKSPADFTVCSCCTNGSNGYFPTEEAFAAAGYERDASRFAPNVAKMLENTAIHVIDKLLYNSEVQNG